MTQWPRLRPMGSNGCCLDVRFEVVREFPPPVVSQWNTASHSSSQATINIGRLLQNGRSVLLNPRSCLQAYFIMIPQLERYIKKHLPVSEIRKYFSDLFHSLASGDAGTRNGFRNLVAIVGVSRSVKPIGTLHDLANIKSDGKSWLVFCGFIICLTNVYHMVIWWAWKNLEPATCVVSLHSGSGVSETIPPFCSGSLACNWSETNVGGGIPAYWRAGSEVGVRVGHFHGPEGKKMGKMDVTDSHVCINSKWHLHMSRGLSQSPPPHWTVLPWVYRERKYEYAPSHTHIVLICVRWCIRQFWSTFSR